MQPKHERNHNPVLTMDWGCDEKKLARQNTIIKPYRTKYGWSVPDGFQYWTLCGLCSNGNKLVPGCELDHMVSEDLLKPEQFYGVEVEPTIHEQNKRIKGPHWFCSEINQEVTNHNAIKKFKPAIINFDMIKYPNNCAIEFGRIMLIVARLKHPVMLVGNFVLKAWWHPEKDPNFIIEQLNKTAQVGHALGEANWEYDQKCYKYHGVDGTSKSILGTIILHKK